MSQIRKLQEGGQPESPPVNESPQKPQMLIVGNTEYNMDTYIRELENNFESWLDSTNFNDDQKNEQRKLLPIFIQKLRSGVVTPLEGGGWRDASLEMYNEKKGHDKWGALAWFATEGLRHQNPYKQESTISSRDIPEYDPSKGLSSLKSLIFGQSKPAFIGLDDWTDNTKTKRGLANRSAQVKKGLEAFKANPEKYYKFKYQEDKDDIISKVDYILENVIGDPKTGKGDGIINPNEHFYISNLGFGDVTDLFTTDFKQTSDSQGSGQGTTRQVIDEGQYGDGSYGNTVSAESIASWLYARPRYRVKRTEGIQDLSLGNLQIIGPYYGTQLKSAINSVQDQSILSKSIYDYFYNRKPGAQKIDALLSVFQSNRQLQGIANKYPSHVIKLILDTMVTNGSTDLEPIGSSKYLLSSTRSKNNTILMWDSANGKLSEVSAYYSPTFRNKVLTKFAQKTGIYNIPSNLDWYSSFYKQGGIIKAQKGTNIWGIKNNYYNFTDDVTGENDQKLFWNPELNKWTAMTQAGIDAGLSGTTRDILNQTFNWNNFNTFKNQAITEGKNYFTFDTGSGTFKALDSNIGQDGKTLPNVWNLNDIVNLSPEKGSIGYRINKSKEDFTFDNAFVGDEAYTGDYNDQAAFNNWLAETNKLNSGWKGIYYSKADGTWYRTKNTPTTGNLLTASIIDTWKADDKKDSLENLSQGPSKYDKFMQFFGPASTDISMGIFTNQRNNRGAKRMLNAMEENYKSRPLEVANPLRYNFNATTQGYQRGIDIESRAADAADNYTDASLGVAARRQGTLDRAANDAQVGATISQDLQSQIQQRTANQNQQNQLATQIADANLAETNRVKLAKATVQTENDKINTEIWNKIGAKYAGQLENYFTQTVNRKQDLADTANKLAAQSWFDDAVVNAKIDWETVNGKNDIKWLQSPEYKKLVSEYKKYLALGTNYSPIDYTKGYFQWKNY